MKQKDPRTYKIIGAAMQVHSNLGTGFLEAVYQEALELEFKDLRIPYKCEVEIPILYKSKKLNTSYRADFICFDSIIVELKALKLLSGVEEAQIINYLKATKLETGLLLNFGAESLEYKRYIFSSNTIQISE